MTSIFTAGLDLRRHGLRLLRTVFPYLRDRGVGDLVLFGSNAMSVYLDNPLRTKDLDLVSSQYGPLHHASLREHILYAGIEVRSSTVQTKPLTHGDMTIYTLELRLDASPFFVEIFDRVLDGKPVSILGPYVQHVKKWDLEIWVPCLNAVVALRLAFRQPEGINRFNATRLNTLIKKNENIIDPSTIGKIITEWDVCEMVRTNLESLRKTHRMRIAHQKEILRSLD